MAEENNGSWPNQQTPQSSEQPHDEQPNQTPQIVEGDQFTMTTSGEAANAEQPTETIPTAAAPAPSSRISVPTATAPDIRPSGRNSRFPSPQASTTDSPSVWPEPENRAATAAAGAIC